MSDENMAELLPLFYWVHIDAPGQVSHEYTERERDMQVHSTHTRTCIHSLLVHVTLHVPYSGNETTLMYIVCKHIVTLWTTQSISSCYSFIGR